MTAYWPLPPRNAIFSGYTMGYAYFKELVLAINADFATVCSDPEYGPQPIEMYVCAYDNWQRRLPQSDLIKAPILKVYDLKENEPEATRFFFPTRAVGALDDDSTADTSESTALETDLDRRRQGEWMEVIKRRHNFTVDKSRLRFESRKDVYSALGI